MSSSVRRRRRTLEERVGASIRHVRPGDLAGRGEPLPRDRGGGRVNANPGAGGDDGVQIEHVTAYATAGQSIADGGAAVTFDREAGPPAGRRGFATFSAQLAADGEVSAIPIDLTGFAVVKYRRLFRDHKQSGNLTVRITREGTDIDHLVPMGPPATRLFDETFPRFEVRAGDTLTILEPNTSGAAQELNTDELGDNIIDVAVWAEAPITSTVPQPLDASGITFDEANDWVNLNVPADTAPGDLLIAIYVSHAISESGSFTVHTTCDFEGGGYTPRFAERPNDFFNTFIGSKIADTGDVPGADMPDFTMSGGTGGFARNVAVVRIPQAAIHGTADAVYTENAGTSPTADTTDLAFGQLGLVVLSLGEISGNGVSGMVTDAGTAIIVNDGNEFGFWVGYAPVGTTGTFEVGVTVANAVESLGMPLTIGAT